MANHSSPPVGDAALAARVAVADVAAFGTLYDRYAREVYAIAAHALGREEAEEFVQDVFVRLWRRAGQFDPQRGSFAAWFMTLARHCLLDELRRRRSAAAAAEAIDDLLVAADPAYEPEEQSLVAERRALVLRALRDLPADQRRVLVLAYFGDLSQSAIAARLGWPLGTVKKRMRLGLQKLRASLLGEGLVEEMETEKVSSE